MIGNMAMFNLSWSKLSNKKCNHCDLLIVENSIASQQSVGTNG